MMEHIFRLLQVFAIAVGALIFLYTAAQLVTLGVIRALRKMKGQTDERK